MFPNIPDGTLLDLHCHMNGNGPDNRWSNITSLCRMVRDVGGHGLMLGCHDFVCPPELRRRAEDQFGLIVIAGAEITTTAGHLLALGIDKIIPAIHGRNTDPVPLEPAVAAIHDQGGLAIIAHPFRGDFPWTVDLEAIGDLVDGVEIRNLKAWLRHGIEEFIVPDRFNWRRTSGSDCHPWEGDGVSPDYLTTW